MNNPAYYEAQNNAAEEARWARECVAAAADEVYHGRDIHAVAPEWGISVGEIDRYLKTHYK